VLNKSIILFEFPVDIEGFAGMYSINSVLTDRIQINWAIFRFILKLMRLKSSKILCNSKNNI